MHTQKFGRFRDSFQIQQNAMDQQETILTSFNQTLLKELQLLSATVAE
jgi:hypothetical protein